jgi:AcrR family transcriptional regulator
MSKTPSKPSDARQRIVMMAERLFYAEGVRAVGIDRIIAEAKVAKMTLYKHFASKDDLILAVLQSWVQTSDEMFEQLMSTHINEGMDKLQAFFLALKNWFDSPGFRGCMFINFSVELADAQHAGSAAAALSKKRFHQMVKNIIVESAGNKVAESSAAAICLLIEGAIISAVMQVSSNPADVARDATMALLGTAKRK